MRTTIFLSIIFLSLPILSFAQQYEYVPFPTENANWTMEQFWQTSPDHLGVKNIKYLITNRDTIFDDKVYNIVDVRERRLTCWNTLLLNDITEMHAEEPDRYWAGIREEDKKVYLHFADEERMIYDFNAELGDITVYGIWGPYMRPLTYIDSIEVSGTLRKRFHFDGIKIIEGIGMASSFTEGPVFSCMEVNDELIYQNENEINCIVLDEYDPDFVIDYDIICPPDTTMNDNPDDVCITENPEEEDIFFTEMTFYPNPVSDLLTIESPETTIIYGITIYDSSGRDLYNWKGRTNQYQVDMSDWPPGVYICSYEIGNIFRTEYKTEKILKK